MTTVVPVKTSRCTLVTGGTATQRLAAIAGRIDPEQMTAVIAEGPQNGASLPAAMPMADPASASAPLRIAMIAAGCPHCDAGLVMRVTLDRILRRPPDALYISLADSLHLQHLQQFLANPPYTRLVTLAPTLHAGS